MALLQGCLLEGNRNNWKARLSTEVKVAHAVRNPESLTCSPWTPLAAVVGRIQEAAAFGGHWVKFMPHSSWWS